MDIRSFGWLTTRRITNAWALTGVLALVLGAGCILSARAEVRLPSVFCDHIVLQRDKPIRVWGWAPAGETIIVEFSGQTKEAKVDSQGEMAGATGAASSLG